MCGDENTSLPGISTCGTPKHLLVFLIIEVITAPFKEIVVSKVTILIVDCCLFWLLVLYHGRIFARDSAQLSSSQRLECYVTQQYSFRVLFYLLPLLSYDFTMTTNNINLGAHFFIDTV